MEISVIPGRAMRKHREGKGIHSLAQISGCPSLVLASGSRSPGMTMPIQRGWSVQ